MKIAKSKGDKRLSGQSEKFITKVSEKHGYFPFLHLFATLGVILIAKCQFWLKIYWIFVLGLVVC